MEDRLVIKPTTKRPFKLLGLPVRVTANEYVNFVLVQDLLTAILNILIVCLELDSYPGNETLLYSVIALPSIQLLLTFAVLLVKYECLKSNTYKPRMGVYNGLRLAIVVLTMLVLVTHTVLKSNDYLRSPDDRSTVVLVACILYCAYTLAYGVFVWQFFRVASSDVDQTGERLDRR